MQTILWHLFRLVSLWCCHKFVSSVVHLIARYKDPSTLLTSRVQPRYELSINLASVTDQTSVDVRANVEFEDQTGVLAVITQRTIAIRDTKGQASALFFYVARNQLLTYNGF
jgi:hypothetical protein